jgi:hypothetical protein
MSGTYSDPADRACIFNLYVKCHRPKLSDLYLQRRLSLKCTIIYYSWQSTFLLWLHPQFEKSSGLPVGLVLQAHHLFLLQHGTTVLYFFTHRWVRLKNFLSMRNLLNGDRLIFVISRCEELSDSEEQRNVMFLCERAKVGQKNATTHHRTYKVEWRTDKFCHSLGVLLLYC